MTAKDAEDSDDEVVSVASASDDKVLHQTEEAAVPPNPISPASPREVAGEAAAPPQPTPLASPSEVAGKAAAPSQLTSLASPSEEAGEAAAPPQPTPPSSPSEAAGEAAAPPNPTPPASLSEAAGEAAGPPQPTPPASPREVAGKAAAPPQATPHASPSEAAGEAAAPTNPTPSASPSEASGEAAAPPQPTTPASPREVAGNAAAPPQPTPHASPSEAAGEAAAPTNPTPSASPSEAAGEAAAPPQPTPPASPPEVAGKAAATPQPTPHASPLEAPGEAATPPNATPPASPSEAAGEAAAPSNPTPPASPSEAAGKAAAPSKPTPALPPGAAGNADSGPHGKTPESFQRSQSDEQSGDVPSHSVEVEAASRLADARIAFTRGSYGEAFKLAEKARELYKGARDDEGEAKTVRFLVEVCLADQRIDDALDLAEKSLSSFKKPAVPFGKKPAVSGPEATASLALADVYLAMERLSPALKIATAALEAFRKLEDDAGMVAALQALVSGNLKVGGESTLNALQSAEEALTVCERVGDMEEESGVFLTLSRVHRLRGEYGQAEDYADKSVAAAQKKGSKTGHASGLKELAKVHVASVGKLDAALRASREAAGLFEEASEPLGEVAARRVVAKVHDALGNSADADRAVRDALVLAQKIGHRGQIAATLLLMRGFSPSEALMEVLKEEAQLAKEQGDGVRQVAALRMLIDLQLEKELSAEASTATKQVEALVAEATDKKVRGVGTFLLAQLHKESASLEKALDCAIKALALFREVGAKSEALTTLHLMSEIHAEAGNEEELLKVFEEQQVINKAAGWKEEEAELLLKVSELHFRLHGPKAASKTAKEAADLFGELQDKLGEGHALLMLAGFHGETNRGTDALQAASSARMLFQSLKDIDGETRALLASANAYLTNNMSEQALGIATEAQKLAQSVGDIVCEAMSFEAIATVHIRDLDRGRTPKEKALEGALHATRQALKLCKEAEDEKGEIESLLRLARLYTAQEDVDAVQAAEESLELCIKVNDPHATGVCLLTLAETYLAFNDGEKAAEMAQNAATLFEELGDKQNSDISSELLTSAKKLGKAGGPFAKSSRGVGPPQTAKTQHGKWTKEPSSARPAAPDSSAPRPGKAQAPPQIFKPRQMPSQQQQQQQQQPQPQAPPQIFKPRQMPSQQQQQPQARPRGVFSGAAEERQRQLASKAAPVSSRYNPPRGLEPPPGMEELT